MNPIKITKKVTQNLISIKSKKNEYAPKNIEEKTIENKYFREIYDFYRLFKVKKFADHYKRADISKDKSLHKQLRNPLLVNWEVLVLAERLKKKDVPKQLYKPTAEDISFFNKGQIFGIKRVSKISVD